MRLIDYIKFLHKLLWESSFRSDVCIFLVDRNYFYLIYRLAILLIGHLGVVISKTDVKIGFLKLLNLLFILKNFLRIIFLMLHEFLCIFHLLAVPRVDEQLHLLATSVRWLH